MVGVSGGVQTIRDVGKAKQDHTKRTRTPKSIISPNDEVRGLTLEGGLKRWRRLGSLQLVTVAADGRTAQG
jgi:hypothetical protein